MNAAICVLLSTGHGLPLWRLLSCANMVQCCKLHPNLPASVSVLLVDPALSEGVVMCGAVRLQSTHPLSVSSLFPLPMPVAVPVFPVPAV